MAMRMHKLTPINPQLPRKTCFVCQRFSERGSNVASNKARFDLHECLKCYVNLEVTEGWICLSCIDNFKKIMMKVDKFRSSAIDGQQKNRCHQSLQDQEQIVKHKPHHDDVEGNNRQPDGDKISSRKDLLSEKCTSSQNSRPRHFDGKFACIAILPKPILSTPQSKHESTECKQDCTIQADHICTSVSNEPCTFVDHSYAAKRKPTCKRKKEPVSTKGTKLLQGVLIKTDTVIRKEQCHTLISAIHTRSTEIIASEFCKIPALQENMVRVMSDQLGSRPEQQRGHKAGQTSVLMHKDFIDLKSLSWEDVISEFVKMYPELLQILLKIMLPLEARQSSTKTNEVVPKLAVIYGIVLQNRNHELSRVQRLIGCLLADNLVEQKVYDRLNKIGICSSYNRMQQVMRGIAGQFNLTQTESLKKEEAICLKSVAKPGFAEIGEKFDQEADVVKRMRGHSTVSAQCDEQKMISDLGEIHPFPHTNDRQFYIKAQNGVESTLQQLDGNH